MARVTFSLDQILLDKIEEAKIQTKRTRSSILCEAIVVGLKEVEKQVTR